MLPLSGGKVLHGIACHTLLPYRIAMARKPGEKTSSIEEAVSPRNAPSRPCIKNMPLTTERLIAAIISPSALFFGEPENMQEDGTSGAAKIQPASQSCSRLSAAPTR